ncbi:hypothetical protein [Pseudochryseolinea flava]|uniref:Uncharacterized protein n=1 Tax=Pseudochryseolinea flava TaxID=2059302 RepID=A0A364Y626_9BACT|nr:hypothetical protein [Pseudochryseolinea flava]RAW01685.1 hypothetical protein DQQ10_08510 [Pseudochryseolinea flava]
MLNIIPGYFQFALNMTFAAMTRMIAPKKARLCNGGMNFQSMLDVKSGFFFLKVAVKKVQPYNLV